MKSRTRKRTLSALIAAATLLTAIPVYAADPNSSDLTLTISKDATYTMKIPSTTSSVTFGTVDTAIGDIIIYGDIGTKQMVTVSAAKEDFKDTKDATNVISFNLKSGTDTFTSAEWVRDDVKELDSNSKKVALTVNIPTENWSGKAPGNYTAKITFQAAISDIQ